VFTADGTVLFQASGVKEANWKDEEIYHAVDDLDSKRRNIAIPFVAADKRSSHSRQLLARETNTLSGD